MRWTTVIAASLALGACSMADDKQAAEEHVVAFHRAYDAQQFEALYDKAAPALHQITPKPQFLDFLRGVRAQLGPVKSAAQESWKVNYDTEGSAVTLVYQTAFANGSATETFLYEPGAEGRLLGYHISSNAPVAAD